MCASNCYQRPDGYLELKLLDLIPQVLSTHVLEVLAQVDSRIAVSGGVCRRWSLKACTERTVTDAFEVPLPKSAFTFHS